MTTHHIPVLLKEVQQYLNLKVGGRYVDATFGGGGHSRAILTATAPTGAVLGLDRDPQAIAAGEKIVASAHGRLKLGNASYDDLPQVLDQLGWEHVDGILLDLGLSSDQLDDPSRGFGAQAAGPLDLRFNQDEGLSTAELLRRWSERELADILYHDGDLRSSRALARRIKEAPPIETGAELLAATGLKHPRVIAQLFQALRIATNDEIGTLERALPKLFRRLTLGGRLVVISFHSGEDRIVKDQFRSWKNDQVATMLTKKPVTATSEELTTNPRARSAKLRAAEKLKE